MATVTANKVWVSGETVTPAGLNATAAPTVVVADNEITTAKIADANVTAAKLASNAVETAKIADATSTTTGVTNSKLRHSAALSVIGRSADSAGAPADIAAANDGEVFRRSGTAVGFGTVATAGIANAAVTPAKLSQPLTLATQVATTSGTSIDFTGIPSWVKRITVILSGVSTNSTSVKLIQLGDSGGIENTGYEGGSQAVVSNQGFSGSYSTAGLPINSAAAADAVSGSLVLNLCDASANTWVAHGVFRNNGSTTCYSAGTKSLSDPLDRIRLTTVNGTDTFDSGSVNIMYEG
jgi:hypothetical protein